MKWNPDLGTTEYYQLFHHIQRLINIFYDSVRKASINNGCEPQWDSDNRRFENLCLSKKQELNYKAIFKYMGQHVKTWFPSKSNESLIINYGWSLSEFSDKLTLYGDTPVPSADFDIIKVTFSNTAATRKRWAEFALINLEELASRHGLSEHIIKIIRHKDLVPPHPPPGYGGASRVKTKKNKIMSLRRKKKGKSSSRKRGRGIREEINVPGFRVSCRKEGTQIAQGYFWIFSQFCLLVW